MPNAQGAVVRPELTVAAVIERHGQFMFVEERIREAPDQWFWMHHRWPKEAWVEAGVM